jgi:hypothetical protein
MGVYVDGQDDVVAPEVQQADSRAEDDEAAGPAWPTADPRMFRGLAGDVVAALDPHTESDPVGVLLTFLTMFGVYVGPGPHARVGGAQHPARLYPLLLGRTSRARKGTGWVDLAAIFQVADEPFIVDRVTSNLGSGEGLLALFDSEDENGDPADTRALIYAPEFAQVLKVCARDGSTLSPMLRDAWDRARLESVVRKQRTRIDGVHVGIVGHVTADELRRHLAQTELVNGFANRFLFACVERSKKLPSGGDLQQHILDVLGRRVRKTAMAVRGFRRMRRTDAAERRWAAIYDDLDDDADGLFGAATARAEAQMLRLQVVYALLDESTDIDVEHIEAARAVWQFCEDSTAWLFGLATGDRVTDRLLDAVQAVGDDGIDGTAQRDLFDRHVAGDALEAARARLEDRGLAVTRKVPTAGRPKLVTYPARQATEATEATEATDGAGRGDLSSQSATEGRPHNPTDRLSSLPSLRSLDEPDPEGKDVPL